MVLLRYVSKVKFALKILLLFVFHLPFQRTDQRVAVGLTELRVLPFKSFGESVYVAFKILRSVVPINLLVFPFLFFPLFEFIHHLLKGVKLYCGDVLCLN